MNPEDMVTELQIPRDAVIPLLKKFSYVRGELSGLLRIPGADDAQATAAALAWWETLSPDEQMVMRSMLAAIASPQLIADISMMAGDRSLLVTRLIMDSRKPGDPVFLVGEDPSGKWYRIERLQSRDLAINTLILNLAGTDPVLSGALLRFDLARDALYVLAAAVDLHRRLRYNSLMNHIPVPDSFRLQEIEKSVSDGYAGRDIRWTLPFVLSVIPRKHQPPSAPAIHEAVTRLQDLNLITKKDGDGQYSWTEPGLLLADSLGEPDYRIGLLLTGALENGDLGIQSLVLARGNSHLWIMDFSGPRAESVFVSTVTFRDIRSVLEGVLMPAGTPRALAETDLQSPAPEQAGVAAVPAGKMQSIHASDRKAFCRNCGSPISEGKKFCSNCGTVVR